MSDYRDVPLVLQIQDLSDQRDVGLSECRTIDTRPVYDIDNVKDSLKFLIDNSYFHVGTQVYRQKIGIPMGLDPAPFLANLYLSYYEIHWVDSLRRIDFARAKKFVNNYRFIDDLAALNDGGEFERSHKSIYPKS